MEIDVPLRPGIPPISPDAINTHLNLTNQNEMQMSAGHPGSRTLGYIKRYIRLGM